MIIPEAIERLAIIGELMATDFSPEDADALKLGIEALKYVRKNREFGDGERHGCLPGEDKEEKVDKKKPRKRWISSL